MKPPYAIGSVPSLSGHAIAYRWRSLPRVRRHRASKPQGSSERVLLWQITMDQLIFASLSHTHYWYEVGMLKVPAVYYWCRTFYVAAGSDFLAANSSAQQSENKYINNCETNYCIYVYSTTTPVSYSYMISGPVSSEEVKCRVFLYY